MNSKKFVTWNIRGANCQPSRFLIRQLAGSCDPLVLCLQETKVKSWTYRAVKSLGMGRKIGWIDVPAKGLSGGLLMVWKADEYQVNSRKKASNWLLISGQMVADNVELVCINVYGPQGTLNKKHLWDELAVAITSLNSPNIIVMGDFNAVRSASERLNCVTKKLDNRFFEDFIMSACLIEVSMNNAKYTWYGPDKNSSKLDRMLVSAEWMTSREWVVQAQHRKTSDHRPLNLSSPKNQWGPKPFRFFNCWLEEKAFVGLLRSAWESNRSNNFCVKFRSLRELAKMWNKQNYGNIDQMIKDLESKQEEQDEGKSIKGHSSFLAELERFYGIKSSILCQKSRTLWQLKGERNTCFFHRAIGRRRSINNIGHLQWKGTLLSSPTQIKAALVEYFSDILTEPSSEPIFKISDSLLQPIPDDKASKLVEKFTMEEVEEALKLTANAKAPGPDGVNAGFLKAIWPSVKSEILQFFDSFHKNSCVPSGYNSSFIALVPKSPVPKAPSDYRPISLMNSVMKLLSKVLARRLKSVMNDVVGPMQSAFISGRQINDSILIASEVVHSLKRNLSSGVVFKIDFEKAFDKVKWSFVLEVLSLMNFNKRWIDWISAIFRSSKILILVNGSPTDEFSPTRGLRQGDPLSPLLFNLVSEVFSKLLERAEINFGKSSLHGYNQTSHCLNNWASTLGCQVGGGSISYLGASIGGSPKSLMFWNPLLKRIKQKAQTLDADSLPLAGRVILLKAVIDSVPSYWLGIFKLPVGVVNMIEKFRRQFLWGSNSNSKPKLHLINWNRVCLPKVKGGLGLVSTSQRNRTMIAKWWWRSYSERSCCWNRLFSARYGSC